MIPAAKAQADSIRSLGSDVSIPAPPPMPRQISGAPPVGAPPALPREHSAPPPPPRELPPPPPPPAAAAAELERVNSAGGVGGGSEKSVQFDDGVLEKAKAKEEAETEKSASEKRKDLLLARMHSNPVGGGGVAEIFGDYDLAADNMKDVINEIGITEVDDPTLMGNKYARGKDFEGDQGGGEIR
jgi:hypothetical protein